METWPTKNTYRRIRILRSRCKYPITGELDLHTFRPRDVKEVVLAYLEACREKGIYTVRIIHGKGIGALRETVHALLAKHPDVVSFNLAGEGMGGWGATMARLKPMEE